ncbi:Signal recognition particle receptor protein FtsY [Euzebya pacifica]|uniref:Signal recognition particle receptor FtsY n=2 Tax=Euzebya pacifica TaxID=1608957 RepID=A0A346Y0X2_9ACTN|nr:Signal recognition particle receptor protein FtsY [Euzebya pacifica]
MSASGGSLRVAMELIIILAVVAVLTLVVVGGLFVGRSKGGTATLPPETKAPTPSSTPTEDAIDPAKTPAIETPEPDEDIDPYPGGPNLLTEDEPDVVVVDEPMSLVQRFRQQLTRASSALGSNLRGIFSSGLTEEAWEELEESLIAADVGVDATLELVEGLRARVKEQGITDGAGALALLKEVLRLELGTADRTMARRPEGTTVWLFTGVNGTGKTTSIGKLAKRHVDAGEKVVLAAADTFRAAASEQLEIWGERSGARVIRQDEGADPAAVAFDGWKAATAANADLLMIDTAGRLQNKKELMAELTKVKKVVVREAEHLDEVLLVIDATTGQNGLSQAKAFTEAVEVTGVVLTKLDGTAKGGIVIAIQRALGLPVKLVGLGEGIEDLAEFDPDAFIDALFAEVVQDVELEDFDAELAELVADQQDDQQGDGTA